MKRGTDRKLTDLGTPRFRSALRELANGRQLAPEVMPAIRAFGRRVPWKLLLLYLMLVVQAGLLLLLWQLIELIISLFEVWALLARHSLGL